MKRDKRFIRFAQKIAAAGSNDVTRIETATASIATTVGSQTFSTIAFTAASPWTINRVNTNLFQPYLSYNLINIIEDIPQQANAVADTWIPGAGFNFCALIKQQKTAVTMHNPNNATAKVSLFVCKARRNQLGPGLSSSYDTPEELIYKGWNMKTTVGSTESSVYSTTLNIRQDISLYDSPLFCHQWKIIKRKNWTMKPGKAVKVHLPFKSFYKWRFTDYFYDTLSTTNPMYNFLKGDYLYLWRIIGEEGVTAAAAAPSDFIYPSTTNVGVELKLKRIYTVGALPNPFNFTTQGTYAFAKDATNSGSLNTGGVSAITSAMVTGRDGKSGVIAPYTTDGVVGVWQSQLVG